MLTADIQINEFNRSMNRVVSRLKIEPRRVFKKELGELVKTLVKLSPPKNLSVSKRKAERDVKAVYRLKPEKPFRGKKIGRGEIHWLYATPFALFGVKNYNFNENYSPVDAKRRLYQMRGKLGDNTWQRLGTRGRGQTSQAIQLLNRKIITKSTFRGVVAKIKSNFGRQKAAWMVGVGRGQIQLTGGNLPPGWVRKHVGGARGDTINNLDTPNFPSFTLINRAVGISKSAAIASKALKIRAQAMKRNLELVLKGIKEY